MMGLREVSEVVCLGLRGVCFGNLANLVWIVETGLIVALMRVGMLVVELELEKLVVYLFAFQACAGFIQGKSPS
jgi:hypothetical protein